jgi:chorismate--pyruvate lyase
VVFQLFPINLPNLWYSSDQKQQNISDSNAESWICSDRSLTVKIQELGIAFSVELLNQVDQPLTQSIKSLLAVDDSSALFREVLLKQGDKPLVYAQTIMPNSTVTGTESILSGLGNQSLGQVLFKSPQTQRSGIEFSIVEPDSQLGQYIEQQLQQPIQEACYMRRSVFHLNGKPLLVCECFLPALFN